MKLVLFDAGDGPTYGMLTPNGIMPTGTPEADDPQAMLEQLIAEFETVRSRLGAMPASATALPLEAVRLLPPVPRPGKILVTTATYGDRTDPPPQLLATLKSAESVIGPGETVRLPEVDASAWQFVPQAMLGLVIRGPAKTVRANAWQTAVFGYTCVIDVMARGDQQFGRDYWLAKADTLGPLGPCIVTADDLTEPGALHVRTWHNGEPVQHFGISDASHTLPEQVEFATTVMTLHTGDVLACGTSAVGLRPLGDGDSIDVEIEAIGQLAVRVAAAVRSAA